MGRDRLRLKYLNKVLRRGKWYWYMRRDGQRTPLPDPTSSDFLDRYYAALAGQTKPQIGASRTIPGTINAAVVSYYNSAAFKSLAGETQRTRRNTLERFRADHGERKTAELSQKHVRILLDGKAATPFMARNFLKTLRGLMQHCVDLGYRHDDPTRGVRYTRIPRDRQGGFLTWSEDQIATFEKKHPIGSRARLAFALLLYPASAAVMCCAWGGNISMTV